MKRIILDCDPGIDDAYALALLCRSPEVALVGVTTQGGNCSGSAAYKNAHALLRLLGRPDIPVIAGAAHPLALPARDAEEVHGAGGLPGADLRGIPEPACDEAAGWIVRETQRTPGALTIVATGPLTNLAQAMRLDPTLPARVGELVVMGGGRFGNVTPHAEFNLAYDPHAAAAVFAAGFPCIRLVPLDATHKIPFTPALYHELLRDATGIGRFLLEASGHYLSYYLSTGAPGFYMHDPLAAAWAIDEAVAPADRARVSVVTEGEESGRSVIEESDTGGVFVARDPDAARFWGLLLPRVFDLSPPRTEALVAEMSGGPSAGA